MISLNRPSFPGALLAGGMLLAALAGPVVGEDSYQSARWDPIHFKPAIDEASDEQCLACHREVLDRRVRESSPAGVRADEVLAWYQTVDTYNGDQETFHRRHLVTDYAQRVMQLRCNTCHQGNDPRDETADSSATGQSHLTQRKQVDPKICLSCHGGFNYQVMGIPGSWAEHGKLFADNCLTCHVAIRTNRHQVNFLKPEAIEAAGQESSESCYGCHGGRAWYRINYPYPRHTWPGDGGVVPDWAKDRSTHSDPRFTVTATTPAAR
jgi:nitrate/TMAO reductase-like tetraheme cytochrome c subunit